MQKPGTQPNVGYAPVPMQPIAAQPGAPGLQWAPAPSHQMPNCPPGLEYLGLVDQILVKQKIELAEVLFSWESRNKYVIMNSMGQQIYRAVERTGCLMRYCCGTNRGFEIFIEDNAGNVRKKTEVMKVIREFKCCAGCSCCACSDCCAFEVRVEAPPGNVIGYTRQMQSCCRIILDVKDENAETALKIRGPICAMGCGDVKFPVLTADESQEVGTITKQWSGFLKEAFTDADNFSVSFPMDLSIKMKATLLGALFLVDFMAFEKQNSSQSSSN